MVNYVISPGGMLKGEIQIPGDKSISHRALMFASLARGISKIDNLLYADDCLATMQVFTQMGVHFERQTDDTLQVTGVGLHG
ncbi:MAG: 3-phosphoshikimate 1-carboxyvinyltransferase, partial [Gammaproteobacteria bacterium]